MTPAEKKLWTHQRAHRMKDIHFRNHTVLAIGAREELHRNMTPAEAKLWAHLRAHRLKDVHFRNQHAIGNYVVDFSPKGTMCAPAPLSTPPPLIA